CSPLRASHSRTVPPLPPGARTLPSGLNATVKSAPRPLMKWSGWGAAASRTITCGSWPPLASSLPSGLNATLFTCPPCPGERFDSLMRLRVPQLHRLVIAAGGHDLAVGAERHGEELRSLAHKGLADLLSRGRVPQPDRAVEAGSGQDRAVPAERHAADIRRMTAAGRIAGLAGLSGEHRRDRHCNPEHDAKTEDGGTAARSPKGQDSAHAAAGRFAHLLDLGRVRAGCFCRRSAHSHCLTGCLSGPAGGVRARTAPGRSGWDREPG